MSMSDVNRGFVVEIVIGSAVLLSVGGAVLFFLSGDDTNVPDDTVLKTDAADVLGGSGSDQDFDERLLLGSVDGKEGGPRDTGELLVRFTDEQEEGVSITDGIYNTGEGTDPVFSGTVVPGSFVQIVAERNGFIVLGSTIADRYGNYTIIFNLADAQDRSGNRIPVDQVSGDWRIMTRVSREGFLNFSYFGLGKVSDLSDVDFSGVDFSGTDLSGAGFSGAILSNVNFSNADFSGVDFSGTDLSGAGFSGAILSNVNFSNADLSGVDFSGTDLSGAGFSGAILSNVNFSNADLSGVDFSGTDLSGAGFSGAILSNVNFSNADLSGVDFSGTDLSGAGFSGAILSNVNFSNADLSGVDLSGVDLSGVDLSGVDLPQLPSFSKGIRPLDPPTFPGITVPTVPPVIPPFISPPLTPSGPSNVPLVGIPGTSGIPSIPVLPGGGSVDGYDITVGERDTDFFGSKLGRLIGIFTSSYLACRFAGVNLAEEGKKLVRKILGKEGNKEEEVGSDEMEVRTRDDLLRKKECGLDSIAKNTASEIAVALSASYIDWALNGMNGKPFFIDNPKLFWDDFQDQAIGRALEENGFGYLCDSQLGRIDIRGVLQTRYNRLVVRPPRCTLSDIRNNFKDFDVTIGADVEGYEGVTVYERTPLDANQHLDRIYDSFDRRYTSLRKDKNTFEEFFEIDQEIQRVREGVEYAEERIVNPDDPTSLAAYTKCKEAENPLNDPTCVKINLSARRISIGLDKSLARQDEFLPHIDESGELFDGLLKQVIGATLNGIIKKAAREGFGQNIRVGAVRQLNIWGSSGTGGGANRQFQGNRWWEQLFSSGIYTNILAAETDFDDSKKLIMFISGNVHTSSDPPDGYTPTADGKYYKRYVGGLDFLSPETLLGYYDNKGSVIGAFSKLLSAISPERSVEVESDQGDTRTEVRAFLFPDDFGRSRAVSGANLQPHSRDENIELLKEIYEATARVYMQLVGISGDYTGGGDTNTFQEYILGTPDGSDLMSDGVSPEEVVRGYVMNLFYNKKARVFSANSSQTAFLSGLGCDGGDDDASAGYIEVKSGYVKTSCTLSGFEDAISLIVQPPLPETKTGNLLSYVFALSHTSGFVDLPKDTSERQQELGEIFTGVGSSNSLSRVWGSLSSEEARRVYNESIFERVRDKVVGIVREVDDGDFISGRVIVTTARPDDEEEPDGYLDGVDDGDEEGVDSNLPTGEDGASSCPPPEPGGNGLQYVRNFAQENGYLDSAGNFTANSASEYIAKSREFVKALAKHLSDTIDPNWGLRWYNHSIKEDLIAYYEREGRHYNIDVILSYSHTIPQRGVPGGLSWQIPGRNDKYSSGARWEKAGSRNPVERISCNTGD